MPIHRSEDPNIRHLKYFDVVRVLVRKTLKITKTVSRPKGPQLTFFRKFEEQIM